LARDALILLAVVVAAGVASQARAAPATPAKVLVAVLPFQVHSARQLGQLEDSLADLLTTRLEASGRVDVLDTVVVREALVAHVAGERTDEMLRRLAREVGADWVVEGSLTELAGSYSLDVRVTPAGERIPSRTMVFTAASDEELLDRVNELADRVLEIVSGEAPRGGVLDVRLEGLEGIQTEGLGERLRTRPGRPYDSEDVRADLATLRSLPGVATVTVETDRRPEGVVVTYRVVPSEQLLGGREPPPEEVIAEVRITGNRRIEADAIRARIKSRPGDRFSAAQVAEDVRQVHALGFFRNVRVLSEESPKGRILTFEIEENPIVRQITIAGNDKVDSERIRDQLTLTTGATLDVPLLIENRERIEALYRAEGYYLANVNYEVEPLPNDAVAVHFEVDEGKKLRLRAIRFEGNKTFTGKELTQGFRTKVWHFWSYATRYLDKSGTYSEPVFLQDLQGVDKKYTDAGFLRVQVGEPVVTTEKDGLVVTVRVDEGERFKVGRLDVAGDPTVDLERTRSELELSKDEWFNRSHLTADVDSLSRRYTDRGFYDASVTPLTSIHEDTRVVDVVFQVDKGPLYFVREIDIDGNTRTVDRVLRREMQLVEGELYSARQVQLSKARLQGLGFFEEVNLEPKPTDKPEEIDLGVHVVEHPTGSLSFGAGFSSQDGFVVSGSLAQSNLFGRGYGVRASVDVGGQRRNFFASFTNRRLLDSEFSLAGTAFGSNLAYESFTEQSIGADLTLGRTLDEAGQQRGFLRYSFIDRTIDPDTNINAAALIFRDFFQQNITTSLVGLSFRADTRNDRVLPTAGYETGLSIEGAGLGGFAKFARFEGRAAWYTKLPEWVPIPLASRSSVLLAARTGYTIPFNTISDYDITDIPFSGCLNIPGVTVVPNQNCTLDTIDTKLTLPLSERYFLGGLGTFQLRGYKARSVGPRRSVLNVQGTGQLSSFYSPVDRDPVTGLCTNSTSDPVNGCNSLNDTTDFANLDNTDVIGGSKFISLTAEYRFPISEQLGLVGILFLDMGNAFAEDQSIFNVGEWRFGTGAGALWFSPFGPLQVFLGIPINRLSVEQATVFEFSVGGSNL
jgi:outer membrane protein insertion porin family